MLLYMDIVAAYVRVSTAQQAEDDSHIRQRETVEEWAESNLEGDYQIKWFEDIAESGQNLSRDEYEEMMEKSPKFDAVVVRELSRFGRSLQKMLNDIEKLEENGCDFISIKDDMINTTSAQGKLMFNIIGAFNQFWADIARERQMEMIQRRREEGKTIGRPRKLTDEQILELYNLREEKEHSYKTLSAIAETQNWCESITRQTMAKYMNKVEDGEITGDNNGT